MLTVKSPAIMLSLMSLWTETNETIMHMKIQNFQCCRNPRNYLKNLHQHGAADQDEEVEPVLVREEGIPNPNDVWQKELLR